MKNSEKNFFDENEWENFSKSLNDPQFVEKIKRDTLREFSKASVLKYKIEKLLKQKLITKNDSIADILMILNREIEHKKQKESYTNFAEFQREANIIKNLIYWFIYNHVIEENTQIEEFLKFLEMVINDAKENQINI